MTTGKIRKGFTLIELLLVVLILGALAVIAVPRMVESSTTAKKNADQTNIDIIDGQLELYLVKTGIQISDEAGYEGLLVEPDYFPDGKPSCPFGTDYDIDTTSKHTKKSDHTH